MVSKTHRRSKSNKNITDKMKHRNQIKSNKNEHSNYTYQTNVVKSKNAIGRQ